jgi:RNA polymerase primary sigma factor
MPLLGPEEEVELTRRIKAGDHAALEKMTKANLRFVVSVAKQYQYQGLTLSDLINEGNVGLMKAARRFDETRGFKFISYAVWWIRQSILQAISEHSRIVRVPSNKIGSYGKISEAFTQFLQEFEREPSNEELAELLDLTERDIDNMTIASQRHVSFDAPVGNEESDATMLDLHVANDSFNAPDHNLTNESLRNEVEIALQHLSNREQDILSDYYGLGGKPQLSLEEIGDKYALTRERVRQIRERAIIRLRRIQNQGDMKSYL